MDFGGQLGSKILPKPGQYRGKSMKHGLPNQLKFCMLFEWSFSGSWKPTWPPKLSQKPPKIDEKSMKNGLPNQVKNCIYFEWAFSGS